MSKRIEEQHARGATIIKLRKIATGEQQDNPLMGELGLVLGLSGGDVVDLLSWGAQHSLHQMNEVVLPLEGLEAAEASVNDMLNSQRGV